MRRLILFGKRPRLGRVKTRMVPPLSADQALELYEAFLADQIRFVQGFRDVADIQLWVDGPWQPDPARYPAIGGLLVRQQGSGDLGQRMLRAFQQAWRDGVSATVILGADTPTLPATHVELAFERLERTVPAVVAPALDGGYVLLGLARPIAELFRSVPWGTRAVMKTTLARARSASIDVEQLPAWYDVDDAACLPRLRKDIDDERAPGTARVLRRLDDSGCSVV